MNGWFGGGQSLGVRCRGVNLCGVFFFFLGGGGWIFVFYIDANSSGVLFVFFGLDFFTAGLKDWRNLPLESGCLVFVRWC